MSIHALTDVANYRHYRTADDVAYCNACYRSVVSPSVRPSVSVTFVHRVKIFGSNGALFGRHTRVHFPK